MIATYVRRCSHAGCTYVGKEKRKGCLTAILLTLPSQTASKLTLPTMELDLDRETTKLKTRHVEGENEKEQENRKESESENEDDGEE